MEFIAGIVLSLSLLFPSKPALAGQYTYQKDVNGSKWYLTTEPCRDRHALWYVPPGLRARAMHGNKVWPLAGTETQSFCWILTAKNEVVMVWPNGRIVVESFYEYKPDKGI